MRENVIIEEAREILLSKTLVMPGEELGLLDSLHRICCQDMICPTNRPAARLSAMDGFALHLEDIQGKHQVRIEQVLLDETPYLTKGISIPVQTGGLLPEGTAAVIPQERVEIKDHLFQSPALKPGRNIRPIGEDWVKGEILIRTGQVISPGAVAVLAASGFERVLVYRQPKVAILSLSPGIVPAGVVPARAETRDSNAPMLSALVMRDGGKIETVGEGEEAQLNMLERMLFECDFLITIGMTYSGSTLDSMGLFRKVGGLPLFQGTRMQPGGHNGAAVCNGKLMLSLSGNPAACAVGYEMLAASVIRKMQGVSPTLQVLKAVCLDDYTVSKIQTRRLVRGHLAYNPTQERWEVSVLPGQKASMLRSLLDCNALIDRPAGSLSLQAGQIVTVIALPATPLE